jgi:hypothetical protein
MIRFVRSFDTAPPDRARVARRLGLRALAIAALVVAGAGAWQPARADAYKDFFEAIARDDADTVRLLVLRGIGTNSADRKLGPALVYAASLKSWSCVRALMESPLTNPNIRNQAGETALMFAALHGEVPVARFLYSKGALINQPGWTPLHYAAMGGKLEMAQWLLKEHAFIDALSPNETTPLMMAAREKQPSMARFLLEEGADPSLRNEAGLTAADYFSRNGDSEHARWMEDKSREFLRRYGTREAPVPAGQR